MALSTADDEPDEVPGRLGEYELLEEVGRGGMGAVWRARQPGLGRVVAIKILPGGEWAGAAARARFRREAAAAAQLRHPGIVAVHDCGEHEGTLWYSMDFIEGEGLDALLRRQGAMPPVEAARMMEKIASAVAYAHEQGVWHRDLKPPNILIDAAGEPHLADFGLAHTQASTGLTMSAHVAGSPHYMPPERIAKRERTEVAEPDGPGDIYSLGATLYHLLTGVPPFRGRDVAAVFAQVASEPPVRPRSVIPDLPRDLENICLHCLEKEPTARYASARDLAEDLGRFLRGEPTRVRPISVVASLWRRCRRHPRVASLTAALALSVLLGTAGIVREWRRAEGRTAEAQAQEYASDVFAAYRAYNSDDLGLARRLLTARDFAAQPTSDLRGFEWWWLRQALTLRPQMELRGHPWIVRNMVFSPDGAQLFSCGSNVRGVTPGTDIAILWDVTTGRKISSSQNLDVLWARTVGWLPDGRLFLAGNHHAYLFPPGDVTTPLWAVPTVRGASYASGRPAFAIPRDVDGWELWNFPSEGPPACERKYPGACEHVVLSPDASLAAGIHGTMLTLWDVTASQPLRTLPHPGRTNTAVFSADHHWLVVLGDYAPQVWNLHDPASPAIALEGHRLSVWNAIFSPDGDSLITTGADRTVRTWDVPGWKQIDILRGHDDEVWCAAVTPDGKKLATGGKESIIRLWPSRQPPPPPMPKHDFQVPLSWTSDSRFLCLSRRDEETILYDVAAGSVAKTVSRENDQPRWQSLTPGGNEVYRLINAPKLALEFLDWRTGSRRTVPLLAFDGGAIEDVMLSANGQRCCVMSKPDQTNVWDARTGQHLRRVTRIEDDVFPYMAVAPEGAWVATSSSRQCFILLTEVDTGRIVELHGHKDRVTGLAFSPDGAVLASSSRDATVRLWRVATGEYIAELRGHPQDVDGLAFSPDGKTLASIGFGEAVWFWNLATQRAVGTIPVPKAVQRISFSPDGAKLAVLKSPEDVMILQAPRD
jgi:eukaryotic-like serine/threonine-protein kinase